MISHAIPFVKHIHHISADFFLIFSQQNFYFEIFPIFY